MTDKLICPYCKNEYIFDSFADDESLAFEENEQTRYCRHCEKEFMFDTTSTIHFRNVCKIEVNND